MVNSLEAAGYTPDDLTRLGQAGKERQEQIKAFLRGYAIIQMVKRLVRRVSFEPSMIGQGWSWWLGPRNGQGLEGEELDCNKRSLALNEVDFCQVLREHCLKEGEGRISGEEKLQRLMVLNVIRLDPGFGWALFKEAGQKTLQWLRETFGMTYLDFFGRVLRDPDGHRCVLFLYWLGGQWNWDASWLELDWDRHHPSAVLALPADRQAGSARVLES